MVFNFQHGRIQKRHVEGRLKDILGENQNNKTNAHGEDCAQDSLSFTCTEIPCFLVAKDLSVAELHVDAHGRRCEYKQKTEVAHDVCRNEELGVGGANTFSYRADCDVFRDLDFI